MLPVCLREKGGWKRARTQRITLDMIDHPQNFSKTGTIFRSSTPANFHQPYQSWATTSSEHCSWCDTFALQAETVDGQLTERAISGDTLRNVKHKEEEKSIVQRQGVLYPSTPFSELPKLEFLGMGATAHISPNIQFLGNYYVQLESQQTSVEVIPKLYTSAASL